jgi:hypothetical protein
MTTPKGMRTQKTDVVHVHRDDTRFGCSYAEDVPTELENDRTSFKSAICLQPGTAHELGLELINVADRHREKSKSTSKAVQGKL